MAAAAKFLDSPMLLELSNWIPNVLNIQLQAMSKE
jgi:hypothetical protein